MSDRPTDKHEGITSLGVNLGAVSSEKPEFVNQKPLLSRITTELDNDPALTNLSLTTNSNVPGTSNNNDKKLSATKSLTSNGTVASSPSANFTDDLGHEARSNSKEAESSEAIDESEVDEECSGCVSPLLKNGNIQRSSHSQQNIAKHKALQFSLTNSARAKRSSIYESRSTVTAIPIRTSSFSGRSFHHDFDDATSMKSVSSSLTASFSKSFLFGFYDNNRKKGKRNKGVLSKEYWMKDESARECFACAKNFNTFRRKHHCRICGQIFCSNCTSLIPGDIFGYNAKMRVCNNCHEHAANYDDSSDESSLDENSHIEEVSNKNNAYEQTTTSNTNNEILQLHDDDVQSILTNGEDSKLFLSTPTPPPRMAIPATRQGEALEISFPTNKPPSNNIHGNMVRQRRGTRDKFTIRDVEVLSPITQESSRSKSTNHSPQRTASVNMNSQIENLKNSITGYIGSNNHSNISQRHSSYTNNNNVIANLANNNFKFEFNYGLNNFQNYLTSNVPNFSKPERKIVEVSETDASPYVPDMDNDNVLDNKEADHNDEGSEDEGSMSLYSALNDSHQNDQNPIRSLRSSTKSFQRAQASLQRMRSRRKSKSRSNIMATSNHRDFAFFNHSAPNLISVISTDKDFQSQHEGSTMARSKFKNDAIPSSRDVKRVLSSVSTLRVNNKENKNELNEVSVLHMKALLKQVLDDQNVEHVGKWIEIFEPILLKIQNIHLDARNSVGLDFRQHYVKIKRISGGLIEESECIDGVVFSKALPLKNMSRVLKNPRILVIMFPLEYQKNEQHFLSLKSVMAQEKEYLNKLVLRLTSLNPDILFVGANVSGHALKLLNDAGIVVQFNMKPQVIERISKLTEADIAISVDKLATNIKLGSCQKFEVKSFVYGNLSKSYTFLSGCKHSLGSTIVLRGATQEVLRKIKDVTEFMVFVVFTLKLESSFFNDNFLQLSSKVYQKRFEKKWTQTSAGYFSEFIDKFNNRLLSISPTVEFPVPFLLAKARELKIKLDQKLEENKHLEQSVNEMPNDFNRNINSLNLGSSLTQTDFKYLVKFIHDKEVEALQDRFNLRSRQWEVSYTLSNNILGTGTHQNITVLYSMVSTKTATPCIGPQLVTIDYFWDNDISIGQFIENIVATANYPCDHGCNGVLLDHYRSYVHGSGKVDVIIEKFQSRLPALKNIILTWSYCKKCGNSTPILQMSEKTWNYSLGKYLELLFWSTSDGLTGIGNCSHDFSKDHVKYFGYNDLVVRMEYSSIEVHELITPRAKITWKPHIDIKLKVELYYQILEKINNFYSSVLARLNRVKLDSVSEEKMQAGQARISDLKARVEDEKSHLLNYVESIYRNTNGDRHLPLNAVIRCLHDNAAGWDTEFSDFEKKFLPSEKDIARITAIQLKKLFMDTEEEAETLERQAVTLSKPREEKTMSEKSLGSEVSTQATLETDLTLEKRKSKVLNEASRIEEIIKQGGGQILNSNRISSNDLIPSRPLLRASHTTPNIRIYSSSTTNSLNTNGNTADTGIPHATETHTLPLSLSRSSSASGINGVKKDVIKELPTSLRRSSINSSGSAISQQSKDANMSSKVVQLANFFDQIHFDALSREFELQREMERLQLNKNKYKALRVKFSTPIVEIYKDVKDAVDEPLHVDSRGARVLGGTKITSSQSKDSSQARVVPSTLMEGLGTELENSIHEWGERVLNANENLTKNRPPDKLPSTNPANEPLPPVITTTTANMDNSSIATQPEKSSLMKTLTNFWADRSATLWKPLEYPTTPSEHIFVDSDVIIREDEPSSLIAFCLSSLDYLQKINNIGGEKQQTPGNNNVNQGDVSAELESHSSGTNITVDDVQLQPSQDTVSPGIPFENSNMERVDTENLKNNTLADLEKVIIKKTGMHLRYQFQEGNSVMSCKIFFAEQFDAFRKTCGCEENFIQSLSRCVKWDSSGGKSGSAFLKTLDDRFVIKELSHAELDAFIKIAPSYFEYMGQAMFHDLPTALAKIFGFYQIQIKNSVSGKSFKMDVIIMENLFYDKKTSRIFDLKGSMRNRHVEQTGKENEVLLDENMVEYIYESPIFVREYDKKLLRASLWNDTLFLAKMNVMDYSLVVGVDNENHNLTVGIIDCIRTFTWDKKLESWVKEKGFVGGSTKEPTVVTPRQYKNRFREAMERYILMVPDPWFQENLSGSKAK